MEKEDPRNPKGPGNRAIDPKQLNSNMLQRWTGIPGTNPGERGRGSRFKSTAAGGHGT